MKKVIFFVVAVVFAVLVIGGFFYYWWQNQANVRELNKTLPEGIRVVKSLTGNKYDIVNKLDGYQFGIPINLNSWNVIGKVEYKNLTNTGSGYRLKMDEAIQKMINSESVLTVSNPNDMMIIEVSSLHLNIEVGLDEFADNFKSKFIPARQGKTIEIVPKIDNILIGGLKILRLSEVSKSLRGEEDVITPQFYLFNSGATVYIVPLDLNDYIVNEIFTNSKW